MTSQQEMLESLTTSLRNAEATFGKGSAQSLDVLEIIEMYMVSLESGTLLQPVTNDRNEKPPEVQKPKKFTGLEFRDLVLRPKPKT